MRSLALLLLLRSAVIKVSGPAACLGGSSLANSATQQLSDMPAVGCNLCGYPLQFPVRSYLLRILLRAAAIKRNGSAASFSLQRHAAECIRYHSLLAGSRFDKYCGRAGFGRVVRREIMRTGNCRANLTILGRPVSWQITSKMLDERIAVGRACGDGTSNQM